MYSSMSAEWQTVVLIKRVNLTKVNKSLPEQIIDKILRMEKVY